MTVSGDTGSDITSSSQIFGNGIINRRPVDLTRACIGYCRSSTSSIGITLHRPRRDGMHTQPGGDARSPVLDVSRWFMDFASASAPSAKRPADGGPQGMDPYISATWSTMVPRSGNGTALGQVGYCHPCGPPDDRFDLNTEPIQRLDAPDSAPRARYSAFQG